MAWVGGDPAPPSVMEPASGSCSVAIVRMSVDLPAPLGPRRPYIPRGMSRLTLRSARTPLVYVLETPRMARCIGAGRATGGTNGCEEIRSSPYGTSQTEVSARQGEGRVDWA